MMYLISNKEEGEIYFKDEEEDLQKFKEKLASSIGSLIVLNWTKEPSTFYYTWYTEEDLYKEVKCKLTKLWAKESTVTQVSIRLFNI